MAKTSDRKRPSDLRGLIDRTARDEVKRIKTETHEAAVKASKKKDPAAFDWRVDLPQVGATVNVWFRITEGDKTRLQRFTGVVIRHRGSGITKCITVRRIVQGEGVERIFPLYSPKIDRIEIVKLGRTRRAKLYYLRHRVGKGTRLREVIQDRGRKPRAAPTR
jgi:large subunit ribosomal protein L19